jgi:Peptidase propeptide and YPEB domain
MKTKFHITIAVAAMAVAGFMVSSLLAAGETEAQLQAQAKITKAEAQTTALAKVPNGTVKAAELEKEHGKLIWSFDIAMPHSKNITEVQVDAKTGKIASVQVETPQDQAKETAADQKNKP